MGRQIRRLLIANRGEIAVRVIRACREAGIAAIAVHDPADAAALHTALADEALPVPSYLDAGSLVEAAVTAGCDAVHPGYGYLAESPEFAEAVERAGLVWVGPPAAVMRALGDKLSARRLAEAAGIPAVPGYAGVDLSDATLIAEAGRVGYPLLVKAAAGGGGRGMRRVEAAGQLVEALAGARREALAAFADDRVYLERALAGARHVEVQVLADRHGRVLHLGERDCSAQRRHQKIVEESPSPAVDDALREALGSAAIELARAAGYSGAGTVEFLLGDDGSWWFLEVNVRLQVEHPVTEAVAGIDLVRAQLEIAAGRPLELEQEDVRPRGHAMECRLYAEDPAAGFVPGDGRLLRFRPPLWPGVRVDTGVREGDAVGLGYDPLLAKLIAHAEDRDACLDRMAAALRETEVLGVRTNLGFLGWLIGQPAFRSGDVDTGYVEREWSASLVPDLPEDVRRRAAAGLAPAGSPWFEDEAGPAPVAADGLVLYEGWQYAIGCDEAQAAGAALAAGALEAPMPGTVLRVDVAPGEPVRAGQTLVVLEAMKMELSVAAPVDGTVRDVHVAAGQLVARGQALVALEEDG
jgi:acetyl/propionyl-CoA carboxylase alpha subunit